MKRSNLLIKWGAAGLDFLFPPLCVSCRRPVVQKDTLCVECFKKLEPIAHPFCSQCGAPFISKIESSVLCLSCISFQPNWEEGRAGLVYNPFSRDLVLGLKYSGKENIAPLFVKFMLLNTLGDLKETDFVVPVPLHVKKLRKRGYNQAVLLGRLFAKQAGLDFFPDLLERHVQTEFLGKSSPMERRHILEDAIRLRKKYSKKSFFGRRAILIDDVMTSGATAEACVKALAPLECSSVMTVVALRGRFKKDSLL
ncbi:ComF family protein [Acetobacteraceae bacterium]|nr:ComF family protein [Acetobacteraceae bacterium]